MIYSIKIELYIFMDSINLYISKKEVFRYSFYYKMYYYEFLYISWLFLKQIYTVTYYWFILINIKVIKNIIYKLDQNFTVSFLLVLL